MASWTEIAEQARRGYTEERLHEVFALVENSTNWKMPIDAWVPKENATEDEIVTAVVYIAGGVPEVVTYEVKPDHWAVTGAGYYEWVGA